MLQENKRLSLSHDFRKESHKAQQKMVITNSQVVKIKDSPMQFEASRISGGDLSASLSEDLIGSDL